MNKIISYARYHCNSDVDHLWQVGCALVNLQTSEHQHTQTEDDQCNEDLILMMPAFQVCYSLPKQHHSSAAGGMLAVQLVTKAYDN